MILDAFLGLESYSEVLEELSEKWNSYMPILLHYDPNRTEISDKLRSYYFSKTGKTGETIKVDPVDDMFNLTKILGAGIFFEGTIFHKLLLIVLNIKL